MLPSHRGRSVTHAAATAAAPTGTRNAPNAAARTNRPTISRAAQPPLPLKAMPRKAATIALRHSHVSGEDKSAHGSFDEAVLTMLDGNGNSAASLTFAANEQGAALCCVRGASQGSKDAPIVSIKDLVAAGIAHAPKPVHIPPLSAAELEEQDAYMLYLSERRERERRDRDREPELYLRETEYDPHSFDSEDGSMRPLKSYKNVWAESDDEDSLEYRERRVILNNVRYNRRQAKRRLRARALARERE
eukprot:5686150-Pleurochrysis_carterae.AAC.1